MRVRRTAVLLLGPMLALGLTACGDDDDTPGTTTTTADGTTSTTAVDTTSTIAGETSTTTSTGEALGEEPPTNADGPDGSGCSPGEGELPDGWWYGTIAASPGEALTFDLACWYTGDAAVAEAARRGEEAPNDFYVVNDNPAERVVAIAPDATASCVEIEQGLEMVDCAPADVAGDWGIWIRVVDGEADRIIEQYVP
jgi:hypothetical protein